MTHPLRRFEILGPQRSTRWYTSTNIENDTRFYFVHSYLLKDFDEEKSFSTTHHGIEFISSIGDENIFATQFHPEKSGEAGLKFFDNFLKWNP